MSDNAAADVVDKVDDAAKTDDTAKVADTAAKDGAPDAAKGSDAAKTGDDKKAADGADKGKDAPKEFVADPAKTDEENAAALAEFEKANKSDDKKPGLPDDWREIAAGGDEDTLKLLRRYGSLSGVAKALVEKDKMIRSGKTKQAMPDPKDEKAMAEWRKAEGIPEEPTGYVLPETVTKRLIDADKPILANFTEFVHSKNGRPDVVEIATEWYIDMEEKAAAKLAEDDKAAAEEAEDALRKDMAHGEYKSQTTVAKRWIETIPGLGADWAEARTPNGRRLGDNPDFILWAAERGMEKFGDVAFATGDSERKHTARREEIEKIRNTDFARYESEGLDKELRKLIEKDLARGKR